MCSTICTSFLFARNLRGDKLKFTPGELKVMQLLWQGGEMKPAEIQAAFPEPIKNAALRSYLSILLEKGHVKRKLVGKAYYYAAITPEHSALQNLLGQLVETFFGGSKQRLIMSLVESEKLTPKQLEELRLAAQRGDRPPAPQVNDAKRPARTAAKRVTKRNATKRGKP